MKKQTEILAIIVALVYRQQSNRNASPAMPPNTIGFLKQALLSIVSETERMVTKLAGIFYHINDESFISMLNLFTLAALITTTVIALYYNLVK